MVSFVESDIAARMTTIDGGFSLLTGESRRRRRNHSVESDSYSLGERSVIVFSLQQP